MIKRPINPFQNLLEHIEKAIIISKNLSPQDIDAADPDYINYLQSQSEYMNNSVRSLRQSCTQKVGQNDFAEV